MNWTCPPEPSEPIIVRLGDLRGERSTVVGADQVQAQV